MKRTLTISAFALAIVVTLTGCISAGEEPSVNSDGVSTKGLTVMKTPPPLAADITSVSGWSVKIASDPAISGNNSVSFANEDNTCELTIYSQLLPVSNPDESNDLTLSENAIKGYAWKTQDADTSSDRSVIAVKNTEGGTVDFVRITYTPETYFDPELEDGTGVYDTPHKGIVTARAFSQKFKIELDGTALDDGSGETPMPDNYEQAVRPQVMMAYLCEEDSFDETEYESLIDAINVTIPFQPSKLEL